MIFLSFGFARRLRTQFATQNPILQPCEFQRSLCEIPKVSRKAKGHLKILFKDLQSLSFRTPHSPFQKTPFTTLRISFLPSGLPAANHLERQPTPLTPVQPWRASKEAIPTLQYLARPGQEPPLLRIHLDYYSKSAI